MDSTLAVAIVALSALTAVNYFLRRDELHPAFVQAMLWTLLVLAVTFQQGDIFNLRTSTLALVVAGAFAFSLGAHLSSLGTKTVRLDLDHQPPFVRVLDLGLLLLATVGLPFFLAKARELAMGGPTDSFLLNIRYSINVEGERFGIVGYLFPISTISLGLHVLYSRVHSGLRIGFATALAFVYAALSTGRTFLFLILVFVLGILLVTRRIRASRAIAVFVVIGLGAFVALGLLLGKGGRIDVTVTENLETMARSIQGYALSPIGALDWLVRRDPTPAYGDNTFRTAYAFYASLSNEQTRVLPLVRDFIVVGIETNVYTVYDPYLRDFGAIGAVLCMALLGSIHGIIYKLARSSSNPMWTLAYSLSLYPLFMQFFQDQYFSLLSTWFQYAGLLVVIGLLSSIGPRQNR